jgi:hypothetical protein
MTDGQDQYLDGHTIFLNAEEGLNYAGNANAFLNYPQTYNFGGILIDFHLDTLIDDLIEYIAGGGGWNDDPYGWGVPLAPLVQGWIVTALENALAGAEIANLRAQDILAVDSSYSSLANDAAELETLITDAKTKMENIVGDETNLLDILNEVADYTINGTINAQDLAPSVRDEMERMTYLYKDDYQAYLDYIPFDRILITETETLYTTEADQDVAYITSTVKGIAQPGMLAESTSVTRYEMVGQSMTNPALQSSDTYNYHLTEDNSTPFNLRYLLTNYDGPSYVQKADGYVLVDEMVDWFDVLTAEYEETADSNFLEITDTDKNITYKIMLASVDRERVLLREFDDLGNMEEQVIRYSTISNMNMSILTP